MMKFELESLLHSDEVDEQAPRGRVLKLGGLPQAGPLAGHGRRSDGALKGRLP